MLFYAAFAVYLHLLLVLLFNRGIDLTGSTVGFAFVGTMCSETHSVGLTEDGSRNLASTASTAAHELGHIFNMNHDGNSLLHVYKLQNLFYCLVW